MIYLPLIKRLFLNKTFAINRFYLPLMENFTVNVNYLTLINLKNIIEYN